MVRAYRRNRSKYAYSIRPKGKIIKMWFDSLRNAIENQDEDEAELIIISGKDLLFIGGLMLLNIFFILVPRLFVLSTAVAAAVTTQELTLLLWLLLEVLEGGWIQVVRISTTSLLAVKIYLADVNNIPIATTIVVVVVLSYC